MFTFSFALAGSAHPGPVDGHGCHRNADGSDFHCHEDRPSVPDAEQQGKGDAPETPKEGSDDQSPRPESSEPHQDDSPVDSVPTAKEASSEGAEANADVENSTQEKRARDESNQAEVEKPQRSPLVEDEQDTKVVGGSESELSELRQRVKALEDQQDKHRFDNGRAGLWLGLSVGAVAVSSLVSAALVPPGTPGAANIVVSSLSGSLVTGSIFSLQMGHRSPTAVAGGLLVIGNFVAPIIAASALNSQ